MLVSGSTPTNSRAWPTGPRSVGTTPLSQPPGLANTTTWPRLIELSFSTTTRSSICSVFCMEIDGMMNICPTKPRNSDATITAPMTTANSSRTNAPAC